MDVLVSFVNQSFTPDLKLGLLDTDTGEFGWVVDGIADIGFGATGLVATDTSLYVCCQQSELVVFESTGLVQRYVPENIVDPHSLLFFEDRLLCVSSGTNEIWELTLDRARRIIGETLFWRVKRSPKTYDKFHLNSIAEKDGEIYATMFGNRSQRQMWSEVTQGCVVNTTSDETTIGGLRHPHTLTRVDGRLAFCESLAGSVDFVDEELPRIRVGGYTRGLSQSEGILYVGSSCRRKLSKSTKKVIRGRVGDFEDETAECRVVSIDLTESKILNTWDLSLYANEIYDVWTKPPAWVRNLTIANPLDARIRSFEKRAATLVETAETLVESSELHLNKRVASLKNQLTAEPEEVARQTTNNSALASKNATLSESIKKLKHENAARIEEVGRLDAAHKQEKDTNTQLQAKNSELIDSVSVLSRSAEQLAQELSLARESNNDADSRLREATEQNAKLANKLDEAHREHRKAVDQHAVAVEALSREHATALESRRRQYEDALEQWRESLAELTEEKSQLERELLSALAAPIHKRRKLLRNLADRLSSPDATLKNGATE